METFDLGESFYGNKHGTPRNVKLKHLCKHPNCFYCACSSWHHEANSIHSLSSQQFQFCMQAGDHYTQTQIYM